MRMTLEPMLRHAFERFAHAIFRFYARLSVTFAEPLPSGPFLLCSNHSSHMDSAALMVATGLRFDDFRLLAAADYFDPSTLTGRLTRIVLNIVAIDRGSGRSARLRSTIAECDELIRTEHVRLIAFPEGTRSMTGELLPFKRGSAFLAVSLGLPVVPAYVAGARDALPKGRWIPRPRPVRVRFGPAIRPADWSAIAGQKVRCDFVTRELEARVRSLAGF